jgi:hypothetical protein
MLIVKFIVRHTHFSACMSSIFLFLPSMAFCCQMRVVYLSVVTDHDNTDF